MISRFRSNSKGNVYQTNDGTFSPIKPVSGDFVCSFKTAGFIEIWSDKKEASSDPNFDTSLDKEEIELFCYDRDKFDAKLGQIVTDAEIRLFEEENCKKEIPEQFRATVAQVASDKQGQINEDYKKTEMRTIVVVGMHKPIPNKVEAFGLYVNFVEFSREKIKLLYSWVVDVIGNQSPEKPQILLAETRNRIAGAFTSNSELVAIDVKDCRNILRAIKLRMEHCKAKSELAVVWEKHPETIKVFGKEYKGQHCFNHQIIGCYNSYTMDLMQDLHAELHAVLFDFNEECE